MGAYRSREQLAEWVDEFGRLGDPVLATLRVIDQDGGDGADTGLVVCDVGRVRMSVYIEPIARGDARWAATIEPSEDPHPSSAEDLAHLAVEFEAVSALVAFLEAKSAPPETLDRRSASHDRRTALADPSDAW